MLAFLGLSENRCRFAMFKQVWVRFRACLSANLMVGFAIWLVAGLTCFAYYENEECRQALNFLKELKNSWGFAYSALFTAFFGGMLPYLILLFRKSIPKRQRISWFLFFLFFWAFKGVEVDAFYRLQAMLFGDLVNPITVVKKVSMDLFVYCVFWSGPMTALCYGWKKADFKWRKFASYLGWGNFVEETLFLLLSTWIIWLPALTVVYAMPTDLQMPMFNLTLLFFVLMISVAKRSEEFEEKFLQSG